ncbi:MAG TPA: 6-bladed beta-propeller, partial [Gemmatimonadota bacterium]|nr:6-bladed beta-propeller [Gemmatimonadota bacterium]
MDIVVKTPYSLLPSVALLALALLGCSGSQRSDGGNWVAVYDTVGDTLIVRTESGSVWGEAAALVADVTIGTLEGPDEYMLGDVVSLAVDTDGSIYIYDGHAKALRKYAPEGTYLGTFGREGAGPGEYKTPDAGLVVLSDGRVVLRDPGNARFNIYSSTGEFLDSWRAMGSIRSSYPMFRDTADNVYSRVVIQANADVSEWKFGLARYGP